ncbi:MAG: acyltransferase family protein [Lachnospiraceae bacterium]|nr:acyltransferase family protein [Lachnospiraceae bacterium]
MYSFILSLCVLLFFAVSVFWKYERRPHQDLQRETFLQDLNNLRGIFALDIVIGHVIRFERSILYPLGKFMICSVAFFFFVSAFGMAVSFEKKPDYVNCRFIIAKPVYLIILSVVIFAFNVGVDVICPNNLRYLTRPLYHTYLIETNWYIWDLIFYYLLFFLAYKYFYRFHILFITVTIVLQVIILYMNGFSEAWLASSFAFPFGLFVGEYFDAIKKFFFSGKGIVATVLLSLFGLSSLFVTTENMFSLVFMRNAICLATIIILLYFCRFFRLGNNVVARYLNQYATEMFLLQFVWLRLTESYGWHYTIRVMVVLFATWISAILLHPIVITIKKSLLRITSPGI